jgi:trans-aconitate 2-methyltransferase
MDTTTDARPGELSAPTWDPQQYNLFAAERSRPFDDLLARVDKPAPRDVADLGCGPGNLTAKLSDLWPAARVVGVDNSPEMLAEARARTRLGRLEFELADLATWQPSGQFDVIVSNATLQWVPGHLALFERLTSWLRPGGYFAMQVPGNFGEPTHTLLHWLASSPRWAPRLDGKIGQPPGSHDPGDYLARLLGLGLGALAWETTYLQVLQGEDAVVNWMKGTALRPFLSALSVAEARDFVAEYRELLAEAYRPTESGTVLPYRRVFAVGHRPGGDVPAVVSGLDHTQVAIPTGGEAAGRRFYSELLGMVEVDKPAALAARGGCWLKAYRTELHLGVDGDFRPAQKAHVGLVVTDLDALADRLRAAGHRVTFDDELRPRRRFFTDDPFGNRLEVMAPD